MRYSDHLKRTLKLALPLAGGHVVQMLINITDAIMVGWYSVEAFAALVLGTTCLFVIYILGAGFSQAVPALVAQAVARGELNTARRVTRMALWLSILSSAVGLVILSFTDTILVAIGQDANLSFLAQSYVSIAGFSLFAGLCLASLRSFLSGLELVGVAFVVSVAGGCLNAVLNYVLIFGYYGAPELGIQGAAIASVGSNVFMAVCLGVYTVIKLPQYKLFYRFWMADRKVFMLVFSMGFPIGLTMLAEVGLFSVSSIMMGWFGTIPLAAHGIALQLTSIMFVIHLGLSNAVTVRAGNAYGRADYQGLKQGAYVASGLSFVVAVVTLALFVFVPEPLVALFIDHDEPARDAIIQMGVLLLWMAALFQFVDAGQVLAMGLLRGVQDIKIPMYIAAFSYWGIGVPVAYLLGVVLDLQGVGIWLGLLCGLGAAAALLGLRIYRIVPHTMNAAGLA